MSNINASTARYCYLDFDFDQDRAKLARCAAFVHATDARYGFSSKDLRQLGGSERKRIPEFMAMDHEWNNDALGGIVADQKDRRNSVLSRPPLPAGNRVVVQLYWDIAPMACENFATLCNNGSMPASKIPLGTESGKPLCYKNCNVHRIQSNFVLQAGDFVKGNGTAGESIFSGKRFKDERAGLLQEHSERGVLSMGNSGKHSNSSQFFITLAPTPQCNGKHVVFGKVVSGWTVLDYAHEEFATPDGTPRAPVTITDCGLYVGDGATMTPAAGYWYDQPDDEAFTGISPVFMVRPRVVVIGPTLAVANKFEAAMKGLVVVVLKLSIEEADISKEELQAKLQSLLDQHSVDVILVAPACQETVAGLDLVHPSIMERDQVVLESKPVDALQVVHTKSWMGRQSTWQLDGRV